MFRIKESKYVHNFVFSSFGEDNFAVTSKKEEESRTMTDEIKPEDHYVPLSETQDRSIDSVCNVSLARIESDSSSIDWKLWNKHAIDFSSWIRKACKLYKETVLFDCNLDLQRLNHEERAFIESVEFDPVRSTWRWIGEFPESLQVLNRKLIELNSLQEDNWGELFERSKERIKNLCSSGSMSKEKRNKAKEIKDFYSEWKTNYESILINSLVE